jgi:thiol-disulfide isomerase/thioredoxin
MQLEDMRGGRHDLSRALADDRSVALVFWQSWCAPCIREAPGVASASKRLDGEVDFYGVVSGPDDVVDEQAVTDTARRLELPYPQVRDRSGELARRFEVVGTPTIVVIEPSGRVSFNGHELPPSWSARAGAGR